MTGTVAEIGQVVRAGLVDRGARRQNGIRARRGESTSERCSELRDHLDKGFNRNGTPRLLQAERVWEGTRSGEVRSGQVSGDVIGRLLVRLPGDGPLCPLPLADGTRRGSENRSSSRLFSSADDRPARSAAAATAARTSSRNRPVSTRGTGRQGASPSGGVPSRLSRSGQPGHDTTPHYGYSLSPRHALRGHSRRACRSREGSVSVSAPRCKGQAARLEGHLEAAAKVPEGERASRTVLVSPVGDCHVFNS